MTTVPVAQSAKPSQSDAVGAGAMFAVITPVAAVQAGLLALAFIGLFYNWFLTQHRHSWGNGDWSHTYIVPLVSLYLLWQHRAALAAIRPAAFWPGLVPLLVGILSYVFFIVGVPNHMGQGFAMVLSLFGLVLTLMGPKAMEYLFFPVSYLVFGVTISQKIMLAITFKLQEIASQGSWVMLNILGITTDLRGHTLEIIRSDGSMHPLNVAEACSGMRMLIAFIALGVAVALVACKHWWQRVAIVLLAAPVALLINVFRVTFLGVASLVNPDLADGDAHMFLGTLWLIPGFFLYMFIVWALNKSVSDGHSTPGQGGAA